MKQTPELDRAQDNMRPGEITLHGFLGQDTRKLVDIIAEDDEAVSALGVTHAQIADRLDAIMEQARDIMESEVELESRYLVTVRDDRGLLPSPFSDGRFEKGDCHLHDKQTDADLRWNKLTIHMIREHGFYSGKGSEYRLDPATIVNALNIPPQSE